ncbi:heptaprenyl pyrophosphate synthase subunit A [Staphylococcus epidermidis]|nr:heptaprenyl pyrophosphate synthase subunit A [Staphylococcus epidermidis]
METTISKLNKHVEQLLKGINEYEPIEINSSLSHLLDMYSIPDEAKIACLTIDTSMRHLDAIGDNHLSKKAILIGDLLSAHFYTLLANIQDSAFQLAMSKAIVKINEDKSSINQNDLTDKELKDEILDIETLFPYLTINHFGSSVDKIKLFAELTSKYKDYHPEYLGKFNRYEIDKYIQEISKSYKKRGNENG